MAVGDEWVMQWLHSRAALGIRPGLTRMQLVLEQMGHPQRRLQYVHVAGTNGKGSVSAILGALLRRKLRVGLYTSPGEDGLLGRFEVLGEDLIQADVDAAAKAVQSAETSATADDPLTQFEALTAMAFVYFSRREVDIVVLEAGLGGRLDSTNVIVPLVSVITNVSLDHQGVLGSTIRMIAREKAGIMKPGVPVVTGARDDGLAVVRKTAAKMRGDLYVRGVEFVATRDSYTKRGQVFTYRGLHEDIHRVVLPLFGSYQTDNAALALAACELTLERLEMPRLSQQEVRAAAAAVTWPGRFEVLWHQGHPLVMDGAHNEAGARALYKSVKDFTSLWRMREEDWLFVVGVMKDKDVEAMLHAMLPLMHKVIVCKPRNRRALAEGTLADEVLRFNPQAQVQIVPDVSDALAAAIPQNCPVCCWGSLYTVEEARKAIQTGLIG